MDNRPQVRTQHPTADSVIGGDFNLDRQLSRGPSLAGKDPPQVGVGNPQGPLELHERGGHKAAEVIHASNSIAREARVKPAWPDCLNCNPSHIWFMDKWPQRSSFAKQLHDYCKREGKTHEEFAKALGIKLSHLQNLLYRGRTTTTKVLQKAALLFGCSILEFVDDPAQEIPGISQDTLKDSTEEDRVYLRALALDIKTLGTPEKKKIAMVAWSNLVQALKGN